MYPLALILGIAAFRRDWDIRIYAVPTAAIGSVIALYHFLLERFPDALEFELPAARSHPVPCRGSPSTASSPWRTWRCRASP